MTERITDRIEIVNADCYTLLDGWPSDAALVSDPPYGIGYVSRHNQGRGDCDLIRKDGNFAPIHGDDSPFDPIPFLRFKAVCLWGAQHYASRLPDRRAWLVWDKLAGKTPCDQSDAELAWTSGNGPVRIFTHLWRGIMRAGEENVTNGGKLHPNQKPVALLAWTLATCGIRDGLVIDPFMGSGSLGVACHRAGLRYLGVEIDPEHYATAKARLQRETAQGLLCMPNDKAQFREEQIKLECLVGAPH